MCAMASGGIPSPESRTTRRTHSPKCRSRVEDDVLWADHDVLGLDRQPSAAWHRIPGVDDEIQQHLLDLARIAERGPEAGVKDDLQLDVLAYQAAQHVLAARHHLIQIEQLGRDDLLACEGEKVAGQRASALPGGGDVLHESPDRVGRPSFTSCFSSSAPDKTTVSRLLKSCAIPPASLPTLSSFWA